MPTRVRRGTGRIYLPKEGSTVYWIQLDHGERKEREEHARFKNELSHTYDIPAHKRVQDDGTAITNKPFKV